MARTSGEGIRVGVEYQSRVHFDDGYRYPNFDGITVTARGKVDDGEEFTVTVEEINASIALYQITVADSDVTEGRRLIIEFDIDDATFNSQARPLRIPIRNDFEDAE